MAAPIFISLFLTGFSVAILPFQLLSKKVATNVFSLQGWDYPNTSYLDQQQNSLVYLASESAFLGTNDRQVKSASDPVATKPSIPNEALRLIPPPLGKIIENSCNPMPSGEGIPGFHPGLYKEDVLRMLGLPSINLSGYWPHTRAISYNLIPQAVSLGFLFDKKSQRIRQTEAAFTTWVDSQIILVTLNGMLGCKLNQQITQGLEKVRQGKSNRYFFTIESLKGVIESQGSDRIYIGIWEADLH